MCFCVRGGSGNEYYSFILAREPPFIAEFKRMHITSDNGLIRQSQLSSELHDRNGTVLGTFVYAMHLRAPKRDTPRITASQTLLNINVVINSADKAYLKQFEL
jgi:hypothetical protein